MSRAAGSFPCPHAGKRLLPCSVCPRDAACVWQCPKQDDGPPKERATSKGRDASSHLPWALCRHRLATGSLRACTVCLSGQDGTAPVCCCSQRHTTSVAEEGGTKTASPWTGSGNQTGGSWTSDGKTTAARRMSNGFNG